MLIVYVAVRDTLNVNVRNRILYRWRRIGLKKDDAFLIPAIFLALAQTITIHQAANAGLGERPTADDTIHLELFEKVGFLRKQAPPHDSPD